MNELNLRVQDESEIVLPAEIVALPLTLAELGAVVCIMSLQTQRVPKTKSIEQLCKSPEFVTAMKGLKDKRVLSLEVNPPKTVVIKLDFVPLQEAQERESAAG